MRTLVTVGVTVAGLGVLTSCSSGDEAEADAGGYCTDLVVTRTNLETINGGDLSHLVETTAQLHEVGDEAPEAIAEEWATFTGGFDAILSAFEDAGFDSEADMAGLKDGVMPTDVDLAALQTAMDEIQALGNDEFKKAGDTISDHAESECGIDLTT